MRRRVQTTAPVGEPGTPEVPAEAVWSLEPDFEGFEPGSVGKRHPLPDGVSYQMEDLFHGLDGEFL